MRTNAPPKITNKEMMPKKMVPIMFHAERFLRIETIDIPKRIIGLHRRMSRVQLPRKSPQLNIQ